jgi:hypothetical protein
VLFKETIAVYSQNYTKSINIFCYEMQGVVYGTVRGTYNYHWALSVEPTAFTLFQANEIAENSAKN